MKVYFGSIILLYVVRANHPNQDQPRALWRVRVTLNRDVSRLETFD